MVGELSIIWAEMLLFRSLGIALYAAAATGLAHWVVVHVEEPELRSRFGPSYQHYCERVRRWLPWSRRGQPPRGQEPPTSSRDPSGRAQSRPSSDR